ncbi:MAG: hypothetical protein ACLUKN_16015 [Bacilli bacterium]
MDIVKKKQTLALKFIDRALKIFPANQSFLFKRTDIIGAGFFDIAESIRCRSGSDPQICVRRIYSSLLLKNGKFKQA